MHLLRTCRGFLFPEVLDWYDKDTRLFLCDLINANVSGHAWLQAALPALLGGLRIRSLWVLATSAFLASAHSVSELSRAITDFDLEAYTSHAVQSWKTMSRASPPEGLLKKVQKNWDAVACKTILQDILLALVHDPTVKARLLAVSTKESAAWLNALPVATLANLLDDKSLQIAVALRLGIPTNAPHLCVCGDHADPKGYHALSCERYGRLSRHANLNIAVQNVLRKAGIMSELEPYGLILNGGRRPDGLTLSPYNGGKCAAWDVTIVCTQTLCNVAISSTKAGNAANKAEENKRKEVPGNPS